MEYTLSKSTKRCIGHYKELQHLINGIGKTAIMAHIDGDPDKAMQPVINAALELENGIMDIMRDSIRNNLSDNLETTEI